jgi:hypothetical protein
VCPRKLVYQQAQGFLGEVWHARYVRAVVELTRHGPGGDSPSVTPLNFDFWRTSNHAFRAMAAYNVLATGVNLTGHGQPERLTCLSVSSDFFRKLGVDPLWGRGFSEAEPTHLCWLV